MADIINAGVDPHRWFAGVRAGIISGDTGFTSDPEKVKEVDRFLKEHVTKEQRGHAKAANFGLPGGMAAQKFYVTCREQGIKLSLADVAKLRDLWISTFTEMKEHMKPELETAAETVDRQYGITPGHDFSKDIAEASRAAAKAKEKEAEEYEETEDDEEQDNEGRYDKSQMGLYHAELINGMVRAKCSYNSAMNIQSEEAESKPGELLEAALR